MSATASDDAEAGPSSDKRLRATFVLVVAVIVEVAWLKLRVVPQFRGLYADFHALAQLPTLTRMAFGWLPYLVAVSLAGLSLTLGLRGAEKRSWHGTVALILAASTGVGLGITVIWALYYPLQLVSGAVR